MKTVDVGKTLDEGPWSGYQKGLVLLTALTIVFDGVDNQLLGIAVPAMMREWGASRAAFAPVFASGLFGMMLGGIVGGIAGDRLGRRVALLGSVVVFAMLTLSVALVGNLASLGVLRFLAGLGLGGALPNAAALSSEYVPRRYRPFAVTLTIVCVPLGGTLAALLGGSVLPALGWRAVFVIGGLVPLAVALALLPTLPESPRYLARHPHRWPELARVLQRAGRAVENDSAFVDTHEKAVAHTSVAALFTPDFRRDTLALWASYFSCLLAVYLGFYWVPSLLTGAGLDLAMASRGLGALNLGGVAGAIAGALVIGRLGSRPTMLGLSALAVGAAAIMAAMPITAGAAPLPILAMLALLGGAINAVQTTMYALAAHVYPTTVRATGVGAAVAVGRTGALLSTYAGARALEHGGSPAYFILMGAAMVVAGGSLAVVRHHVPRPARPRAADVIQASA